MLCRLEATSTKPFGYIRSQSIARLTSQSTSLTGHCNSISPASLDIHSNLNDRRRLAVLYCIAVNNLDGARPTIYRTRLNMQGGSDTDIKFGRPSSHRYESGCNNVN